MEVEKTRISSALLERATKNLSEAIRIKTISGADEPYDEEFKAFHSFLERAYPLVHKNLRREVIGRASLLFTWSGTNEELEPIVLAAHMDVVPVEEATLPDWTYPPFEGVVAGGEIWGRGTIDCKGQLIAVLEAVESLLGEGYVPSRTVYLAFGDDEEVRGYQGAAKIADLLEERGAKPFLVIDEGGILSETGIPLLRRPLAAVGVADKGYVTLALKATGKGGHSSVPPRHTAIGILARAITRIERHLFPARATEVIIASIEKIAPELPLPLRAIFGNRRICVLFLKIVSRQLDLLRPFLRNTAAVTMIKGGTKDNVLPQEAEAKVNIRLLPGETQETAITAIRKIIRDKRISIEIFGVAENPPPISDSKSKGFAILEQTIKELFPQAIVFPYLLVGMTDSRHYSRISDSVFRFWPIRGGMKLFKLAHGTNERISIENLGEMIIFYRRLIFNSCEVGL